MADKEIRERPKCLPGSRDKDLFPNILVTGFLYGVSDRVAY